jgi:glycosyltransferase involved in cell wall biosynthesis
MEVAYVLPYLQKPGGWRTHAVSFLNAIRTYVDPVLFVSEADTSVARSLFPDDTIYPLPVTQEASLNHWRGLKGLIASQRAIAAGRFPRVELVHSLEAYPTGLVGMWLSHKGDCPHIITAHGTYGVVWYEKPIDRRAYQRVLNDAALVCPVSHGTARLMRQYFGQQLPTERVQPILNGNHFFQDVTRSEATNRHLPAIPTLLSVGDVKPRKGQHVSLAAFARVKQQVPEARYWIIGSYKNKDYYQGLQRFIKEQQVQDVQFFGVLTGEELRRCYQEASLFILTPQQEGLSFEGFGLVYLEAGAYGLPVIATRSGGVVDAVEDGVTGILCEPGDVDGIADSILVLLNDPERSREMGRANRSCAETLTWERNAEEQFQAYQRVLGAS